MLDEKLRHLLHLVSLLNYSKMVIQGFIYLKKKAGVTILIKNRATDKLTAALKWK